MCAAADLSDCRLVCSITPAGVDVKGGGKAAVHGTVNHYAQNSMQAVKEKSCQAMEESQRVASRCFMFETVPNFV